MAIAAFCMKRNLEGSPQSEEAEVSTMMERERSSSSKKSLRKSESRRAKMFQSMWRMSSPETYWRWSANSTEWPRFLDLRSPFSLPKKTRLEERSSGSSLAMSWEERRSSMALGRVGEAVLSMVQFRGIGSPGGGSCGGGRG